MATTSSALVSAIPFSALSGTTPVVLQPHRKFSIKVTAANYLP